MGSKYPITSGERIAIRSRSDSGAKFGEDEIVIYSYYNEETCAPRLNFDRFKYTQGKCRKNGASFMLPAAKGSQYPSIAGGEETFLLKLFEVFSVEVRIIINIVFRNNEKRK
jgi:hypothetical protein